MPNQPKSGAGALYPSHKEWDARGFRACDGYDPEGNIVQLRKSVL